MEEMVMKISPRAYNRKAEFKARAKAEKNRKYVFVNPADSFYYTKEGAFFDWLYCKMAPKERTTKRESLELRRYRKEIRHRMLSKREFRVFEHSFRNKLVTAFFDDEILHHVNVETSHEEEPFYIEEAQPCYMVLENGTCVYEPCIADMLKAFDMATTRLLYVHDDLCNEEFLFNLEMLRTQIETRSVTYDNLLHNTTDIALMAGDSVNKKIFIELLNTMLSKLS